MVKVVGETWEKDWSWKRASNNEVSFNALLFITVMKEVIKKAPAELEQSGTITDNNH